jgi:hypothetical protein
MLYFRVRRGAIHSLGLIIGHREIKVKAGGMDETTKMV